MENKDFVVFILTHGRPDNIITLDTLKKCGYTGKWFLIVDNEDPKYLEYTFKYGNKVIQFHKKDLADQVDEGNNFDDRRTTTHARNFCFIAAKKLKIKYFIQLDDDYTAFHFRYLNKNRDKLLYTFVTNLNYVFDVYLNFFKKTNFKSIAMAQGGDFIGGATGSNPNVFKMPLSRKCMNTFICSVDRPFNFISTINEDVNTYTVLGNRGNLFGTAPYCSIVQKQSQAQNSGMTDTYLKYGTYCKSFSTVMMQPSSVTVSMLNSNNPRIHHNIKWKNTVPCIIDEKWKK